MTVLTQVTANDFLGLGLELAGYKRWQRYKEKRQIERFRAHFGAHPKSCAKIWVDLQTTANDEVRIDSSSSPRDLLIGLVFLWECPTERKFHPMFNLCEETVRNKSKVWTKKIQSLLPDLIGTLEEDNDGLTFILSVDGTHCPTEEPYPWSKKWSSHKLGGSAGFNYEIGLSIHKPKLKWVHGPTPPGESNDIAVFRQKLKAKIPPGKKVIADEGYRGESKIISTRNNLDPSEIAAFKERVTSRHETFNQRLKNFNCLSQRFRHGIERHKVSFEAVCVIVMYDIEHGDTKTLFDPYL